MSGGSAPEPTLDVPSTSGRSSDGPDAFDGDDLLAALRFDRAHNDARNEDDGTQPAETPREARVRRAIEEAKRSYEPVRENSSWFFAADLQRLLLVSLSQPGNSYSPADKWADAEHVQVESAELDRYILDQMSTDKRASHKLDWSLSALYGNDCTRAALTLALALLRTADWTITRTALQALPPPHAGDLSTWDTCPALPPQTPEPPPSSNKKGKLRAKQTEFGFEKEALDIAIRAIIKLLSAPQSQPASGSEQAEQDELHRLALLVASRALKQAPHDGLREALWDGTHEITNGWQKVHWTSTPGLTLSVGHLCAKLGHWRAASTAYALYLGTRGPLRVPARHLANALANLALSGPAFPTATASTTTTTTTTTTAAAAEEEVASIVILAQAFASSFLGATPTAGGQRAEAVADVRAGRVLPAALLVDPRRPRKGRRAGLHADDGGGVSAAAVDNNEHAGDEDQYDEGGEGDADEALLTTLLHAPGPPFLPPEAAIALVRCGPSRRAGLSLRACAHRLWALLDGDGTDGAEGGGGGGEDGDVDARVQVRSVRTL